MTGTPHALAAVRNVLGPIETITLDADVQAQVDKLVGAAEVLPRIANPDMIPAGDALSGKLRKLERELEANRKEWKAEPLRIGRMIDDVAKTAIDALAEARKRIDAQIAAVQEQARREREAAERERERIEAEAAARERKLAEEQERAAREAAERTRQIAELAVKAASEGDRAAVVELLQEANAVDEAARASIATLQTEAREASAQAWVTAIDNVPAPLPKSRVHTRERKVAVCTNASQTVTHVNGVCIVKSWDLTLVAKMLESGVDVPGFELQVERKAVRR